MNYAETTVKEPDIEGDHLLQRLIRSHLRHPFLNIPPAFDGRTLL